MKAVSIILFAMLLTVPCIAQAGQEYISYNEIEELVYQFNYTTENITEYRWSFGDGATSTEVSPTHEYTNHKSYKVICEVTLEDGTIESSEISLDATLPVVDGETGMVNVGDVSVPGGLIFLSSLLMFSLAASNNHIASDIIGKDGKDIMCLFYTLGIIVGAYLIFTSMYPGAI